MTIKDFKALVANGSTEHEALGQCLGEARPYHGDLSELGSAE